MPSTQGLKLTLLFTSSLTVMAGATIAASLPMMSSHFGDSPELETLSKLILTLPALFMAILSPVFGHYLGKIGRIRGLYISLVLYALGGSAGLYANDIYVLLISRGVLGISVALMMTIVSTLVGEYFDGAERHKYTGLQASFMSFGGLVFVTLGGVLADISWRAPFGIYLFSLLLLPFVKKYLYEPTFNPRHDEIIPDGHFIKRVWHIYVIGFIGVLAFYMGPTQLPFLLMNEYHESGTMVGISIGVMTLSSSIMAIFYPKIKARYGFVRIYGFMFLLIGIGFTGIGVSSSLLMVIFFLIFSGLGVGLMMVNGSNYLHHTIDQKNRAKAVGFMMTSVSMGQFLSPLMVAPIVHAQSVSFAFGAVGVVMLLNSFWFLLARSDK